MKNVFGWILAGGHSSRMGQDKALLTLNGKPLVAHVLEAAEAQCYGSVINSNNTSEAFHSFGVPVVHDIQEITQAGPLAAVLTGFTYIKEHHPSCEWLATLPTDTPYVPTALVERALDAAKASGDTVVLTAFDGNLQHTMGLWHVSLYDVLYRAVMRDNVRRVMTFIQEVGYAEIDFVLPAEKAAVNINTLEDFKLAKEKYAEE